MTPAGAAADHPVRGTSARRGIAAIALAAVLAACAPAAPAPAADEGASATTSQSQRVPGLDPSSLVWLSVREQETDDVTSGVELMLVRGDGTVAWGGHLDLDPRVPGGALVVGPRNGVLVYGTSGGDETTVLNIVTATEPQPRELTRLAEIVVGATLDPTGTDLYLALTGDELRVVRIPLDGTRPPAELLAQPVVGRLPLIWDRLSITPDGSRLLVTDCIAGACRWDVVDVATGETEEIAPEGAGPVVDAGDDVLLTTATQCAAGPCPFVLVDLDDGAAVAWDPGAHEARLGLDAVGDTVLLHDRQGLGGAGPITITDPSTGEVLDELRVVDQSGMPLGLARRGQDAWVPRGWELLTLPGTNVGEAGGPTLVRLSDGFVVHLPPPNRP